MRKKIIYLLLLVVLPLAYYWQYRKLGNLHYQYRETPIAKNFEAFYDAKKKQSLAAGVEEQRAEKLVVYNPRRDSLAFLYIHGFGASRGEGEYTLNRLAEELKANVYYLRLPGHGESPEAHAKATFEQYLQTAEEALLHMPLLGKKIVVVGSSTGGLIATYLAARHSDELHALILAAPLWDFANKLTRLLNYPGGFELAQLAMGKDRDASWKSDPEKRLHADYGKYWMLKQKYAAIINLNNLRRFIVKPETFASILCPVLVLYYYKDEQHKDDTVDLKAIEYWFPRIGSTPLGKNRMLAIADGNHVLFSEFVRTDKETILRELRGWLKDL